MNFGDRLKQIRADQGLSQEQLAEKIGVSRQAITKWETNRGLPDVENMIILAEIFKVTLDELILERMNTAEPQQEISYSETVYDIDQLFTENESITYTRKLTEMRRVHDTPSSPRKWNNQNIETDNIENEVCAN